MSDKVLIDRWLLEKWESQLDQIKGAWHVSDEIATVLASHPQSSPITVAASHMREVLAMILQALDRDAAEGRSVRREMAAELRAAMEAQSVPAGERDQGEVQRLREALHKADDVLAALTSFTTPLMYLERKYGKDWRLAVDRIRTELVTAIAASTEQEVEN